MRLNTCALRSRWFDGRSRYFKYLGYTFHIIAEFCLAVALSTFLELDTMVGFSIYSILPLGAMYNGPLVKSLC